MADSPFFEYLQAKAREQPAEPEPEQPTMQPPMECPRCSVLVLHDAMDKHIDWHVRTQT